MDSVFADDEEHKQPVHHDPLSQTILQNDFAFQQSLHLHQGGVRTLAVLPSGYMLSGSIDTTCKLFILNNSTGKYDFDKELRYHTDFIYCIIPQ